MKRSMQARLSVMMFLQYFIWGAWYVTLATWLSSALHLDGQQIGAVAGVTAIGAIVAPFLVGLIADRFFATERVLATMHLLGAILLFFASRQTGFLSVYTLLLIYCACYMPTLALTNSLAFRRMTDTKIEFGPIRVLGTIGWIVAGLIVGGMHWESTAQPLRLAAIASLMMAVYSLTLPHTPPLRQSQRGDLGLGSGNLRSIKEALMLFADRSMAVFALASLLICIPLQFYYAFTNLFLNQIGIVNAAGKMTGGQMSELICMLLLPWFFRRLGVKYMLVAGMSAWVIRYLLFAYGNAGGAMAMLWGGILLHGICYDFFFVTGQIYIDRKAPVYLQSAAQGLITFLTYGVGMFAGSWLSGAVTQHFSVPEHFGITYNWRAIWLFCCFASLLVLIIFLATFADKEPEQPRSVETFGDLPQTAVPE